MATRYAFDNQLILYLEDVADTYVQSFITMDIATCGVLLYTGLSRRVALVQSVEPERSTPHCISFKSVRLTLGSPLAPSPHPVTRYSYQR